MFTHVQNVRKYTGYSVISLAADRATFHVASKGTLLQAANNHLTDICYQLDTNWQPERRQKNITGLAEMPSCVLATGKDW